MLKSEQRRTQHINATPSCLKKQQEEVFWQQEREPEREEPQEDGMETGPRRSKQLKKAPEHEETEVARFSLEMEVEEEEGTNPGTFNTDEDNFPV